MNEAGIIHTQQHHQLYGTSNHQVVIRLQTAANDIDSVYLIHGDPYEWSNGSWQSQKIIMDLVGTDGTYDYWMKDIYIPHSRIRYGFHLISESEETFYTERGLYSEAPTHIAPYFCLPYLHNHERFSAPNWVKDTVWYQIFPERFANGQPHLNPEGTLSWGSEEPKQDSFFGGDLQGIINNLDYLMDLGITGIYLTPIFKAFSNHKYDTIDYLQLDPQFGDEKTLRTLITECHKRNIRIMLDAVFNHSGYYFPPFQDVLEKGADSKYAAWFHPHSFPLDSRLDKPNYETFAFVGSMPKLNTAHPQVKDYLLKVARYWIEEFDIDGWRLDVANEVDHSFWREFRKQVKNIKEDVYILGEIWHHSSEWLKGDQFDAVMNYPLTDAIQDFILRGKSALTTSHTLTRHLNSYPNPVNAVQFNVLGSHDTARILTESSNNKNLVKLQYIMMFSFPGTPCIYYGDEISMAGGDDPGCRACMILDELQQDREMHAFVKQLIKWRTTYSAFGTYDRIQFHEVEDTDVLMYSTYTEKEIILFVFNRGTETATIKLPEQFSNQPFNDLNTGHSLNTLRFDVKKESFLLFSSQL